MKEIILLILMMIMLTACGGEVQESIQIAQDGFATAEAAGTAVADGTVMSPVVAENGATTNDDTAVSEPTAAPSDSTPEAATQNDANTLADAGDINSPTTLEAGMGYLGQLGNGDIWDIYQVHTDAFHVLRVTITADANNSAPIELSMVSSSDKPSNVLSVVAGESGTAVLAANAKQINTIKLFTSGQEGLAYTLDVLIEPENDADSGGDVTDVLAEAMPISTGQTITGMSAYRVNEGGHDNDCYALDLPANAQLVVDISSPLEQPYPESYASIELYGPQDHNYIWGATTTPGGISTLEHTADDAGGRHVLCAVTFEFYPVGVYSFTATVTP